MHKYASRHTISTLIDRLHVWTLSVYDQVLLQDSSKVKFWIFEIKERQLFCNLMTHCYIIASHARTSLIIENSYKYKYPEYIVNHAPGATPPGPEISILTNVRKILDPHLWPPVAHETFPENMFSYSTIFLQLYLTER